MSYYKINNHIKIQVYKKNKNDKGIKFFIRINKYDREFLEFRLKEIEFQAIKKILKLSK